MKKLFLLSLLLSSAAYSNDFKEILLKDSIISSTTGFEEPLMKENKNITLIGKEDLEKKDYKNIEEILRDAPNVMVQETYFGPVIDLRGNGERAISRVKVLVDGVAINPIDESMGTLPINTIPVSSIERIEIIPGGGAVLNGSGTAGGVVNIITKSTARKNYFTTSYGNLSYDTNKTDISGGYNITKNLYTNFGYSYLKGNGYRKNDDRENGSFTGGFDYKLTKRQRIKIQGTKFKGNQDTSNPVKKEILALNRKAAGFPVESKSDRESYVLDHEFKINNNFTLLTTIYKQKFKRNFIEKSKMDYTMMKSGKMPLDIFVPNVNAELNGKFNEESKGAKIRGKLKYSKGELVLGYEYNKTDLERDTIITGSASKYEGKKYIMNIPISIPIFTPVNLNIGIQNKIYKETNAIYGLNRYKLSEKLDFTSGIRYEYSTFGGDRISSFNLKTKRPGFFTFKPVEVNTNKIISDKRSSNNFAGELGLNYSYSGTGSFYSRYERGFISPMPGQITDKTQTGEYKSNNLKSETSDTLEIGVKDFVGNSFVSWSAFTTFTENEISLIQGNVHNPATKWWNYKNLGKTRRIGTEIFAEQYLGKLTLNQGLTYVNTKITDGDYKGDKVPLAPEGKLTLSANYKITENLSSGFLFNYIGKSTTREFDKNDKVLKSTISGYHFSDLMVQYKVNNYFVVSGGVNNVFNEHYNYSETKDTAIPAPGRNYYISGKITL